MEESLKEAYFIRGGTTKPSYNQVVCIVDSFDILRNFVQAFTWNTESKS